MKLVLITYIITFYWQGTTNISLIQKFRYRPLLILQTEGLFNDLARLHDIIKKSIYCVSLTKSWEYSRMYNSQSYPKWARCSERPAQFHTQDSVNVTEEDVGNKNTRQRKQHNETWQGNTVSAALLSTRYLLAWSQLICQVFGLWHNRWISPILKSCKGTLWESGVGSRTTFSHFPSVSGTRTIVELNSQVKLHPKLDWAVHVNALTLLPESELSGRLPTFLSHLCLSCQKQHWRSSKVSFECPPKVEKLIRESVGEESALRQQGWTEQRVMAKTVKEGRR